jgi:hypothetical protein
MKVREEEVEVWSVPRYGGFGEHGIYGIECREGVRERCRSGGGIEGKWLIERGREVGRCRVG